MPAQALDPARLVGSWVFTVDNGQGGFPIEVDIGEGLSTLTVGRIGRSEGDGVTGAVLRGNTLQIDTRMRGWCRRGSAATLEVRFRDDGRFRRGEWSGTCRRQAVGTMPVASGEKVGGR
ncbi:hypothetical protein [Roseovarius ramblicola]|uniref:Uncharacterized protein n=1 Tax=Roseovarius ramblicola TaxID=2022336 RepID=A0ABV5HVZ2_9RHOB